MFIFEIFSLENFKSTLQQHDGEFATNKCKGNWGELQLTNLGRIECLSMFSYLFNVKKLTKLSLLLTYYFLYMSL